MSIKQYVVASVILVISSMLAIVLIAVFSRPTIVTRYVPCPTHPAIYHWPTVNWPMSPMARKMLNG